MRALCLQSFDFGSRRRLELPSRGNAERFHRIAHAPLHHQVELESAWRTALEASRGEIRRNLELREIELVELLTAVERGAPPGEPQRQSRRLDLPPRTGEAAQLRRDRETAARATGSSALGSGAWRTSIPFQKWAATPTIRPASRAAT